MPLRAIITQGTTADCTQAVTLIDGFHTQHLLADRGYDTNAIIEQAKLQGMSPVIPPKNNRQEQRAYDKELYKVFGREGFSLLEAMARHCHPICPKYGLFFGGYTHQMHFPLAAIS